MRNRFIDIVFFDSPKKLEKAKKGRSFPNYFKIWLYSYKGKYCIAFYGLPYLEEGLKYHFYYAFEICLRKQLDLKSNIHIE